MPLFSILVTVYNLEKYIEQCLNSILSQDFEDYELIVVDNGSEDRSIEICQAIQNMHPTKMKFIKLPSPTVYGRSFHTGIKKCKGMYIHSVDGDDFLAPHYLKNIAEIIRTQEPDIIMGGFTGIAEEGLARLNDVSIDADRINKVSYEEAIEYIFSLPYINLTIWRIVAKRKFFPCESKEDDSSYINHPSSSDGSTVAHYLFLAKSIYYYDKPFYYYRRRKGSLSSVFSHSTNRFIYDCFVLCIQTTQVYKQVFKGKNLLNILNLTRESILCRFKLFLSGVDQLDNKSLQDLSEYIDREKDDLELLRLYKIREFDILIDFILRYGSFDGLQMFIEYERSLLLDSINKHEEKDIYIFPTGKYGEATGRLLQNKGVTIKGFLDNDVQKSNQQFLNVPCYVPNELGKMNEIQRTEIIVVIATLYKKLFPVFTKQLIDLGIKKENIVIRGGASELL